MTALRTSLFIFNVIAVGATGVMTTVQTYQMTYEASNSQRIESLESSFDQTEKALDDLDQKLKAMGYYTDARNNN